MESAVFHTPLIHGLPDEIALLCLARVPRRYHNALRCVSKRWGALLCSQEWHFERKRNNLDESWVYVIMNTDIKCYVLAPDPTTRSLKVMQVMEPPCSGREGISIETLDKRLYLLDGLPWPNDANDELYCYDDANDEVYCYDASSNRWSIPAPKPTARGYFAWSDPTVVVDGTLYMLDQSLGTKLMLWQKETKEWVMLGRLSDELKRSPCELVAIGRKIYVIGEGLSTVTIDLDTEAKVDGFLVSSSAGPLVETRLQPHRCRVITV